MFVVPVAGDRIKTKDDSSPAVVTSYSSLKDAPAVYVKDGGVDFVFFSDIVEINGVRVEFDTTSKVFNSLGPLRRRYNLPQPKDSISVKLIDVDYSDEQELLEVTSLKLHSKQYGRERGLLVCTKAGCFNLSDVLDIKRRGVSEKFDQQRFSRYYLDYFPIRAKVKR